MLYQISPNPTNDMLQVNSFLKEISSIQIYDINGRIIQEINIQKFATTFSISHLSKGIYFVRINNEKSIKFIKN